MSRLAADEMPGVEVASIPPTSSAPVDARLSICVCTIGRTEDLRRCLRSIRAVSSRVEVVVSDDGPPGSGCAEIAEEFGARYLVGPRTGISANRNAVIRGSSRDFVMLLDDDAELGADALVVLTGRIPDLPERTILTGVTDEYTRRLGLSSTTYLGFFAEYRGGPIENISLNANVFPAVAFREAGFDEVLEYGYEDMDLCAHLVSRGFHIVFVPSFVNHHGPPRALSSDRERASTRARFYVAIRRRAKWRGRPLSAVVYCVAAACHEGASLVARRRNPLPALGAMSWAVATAWRRRGVVDVAAPGEESW